MFLRSPGNMAPAAEKLRIDPIELARIRALPCVIDPLFDQMMATCDNPTLNGNKNLFPNPPVKLKMVIPDQWSADCRDLLLQHDRYYRWDPRVRDYTRPKSNVGKIKNCRF